MGPGETGTGIWVIREGKRIALRIRENKGAQVGIENVKD